VQHQAARWAGGGWRRSPSTAVAPGGCLSSVSFASRWTMLQPARPPGRTSHLMKPAGEAGDLGRDARPAPRPVSSALAPPTQELAAGCRPLSPRRRRSPLAPCRPAPSAACRPGERLDAARWGRGWAQRGPGGLGHQSPTASLPSARWRGVARLSSGWEGTGERQAHIARACRAWAAPPSHHRGCRHTNAGSLARLLAGARTANSAAVVDAADASEAAESAADCSSTVQHQQHGLAGSSLAGRRLPPRQRRAGAHQRC